MGEETTANLGSFNPPHVHVRARMHTHTRAEFTISRFFVSHEGRPYVSLPGNS